MLPNEGASPTRRLIWVFSGSFRMIWPAETLAAAGHDVTVIKPEHRNLRIDVDRQGRVDRVHLPPGTDVLVLQRVTHPLITAAIPVIRAQGVAVVVDLDDDLSCIHPENPAFIAMHPKSVGVMQGNGVRNQHSWQNLTAACREATYVTVSTDALLARYAAHGRGTRLLNHLPEHYYGLPHADSDLIGWPASVQSHPDDPSVCGPAIARLVADGHRFRVVGWPAGAGRAFGMPTWRPGPDDRTHPLDEWPAAVAQLGIGIAPLSDTRFNQAKSHLKCLELSSLGVPWVASPRAEYRKLHARIPEAGVLVDRPKDWYRVLRDLAANPARRAEMSEAGRKLAEGLRLRDHAYLWLEAWATALRLERANRPSVSRRLFAAAP